MYLLGCGCNINDNGNLLRRPKLICRGCEKDKNIEEFYENYNKCKACCILESTIRNVKNKKDWLKHSRLAKTKAELEKIKLNLQDKNYMNNAIEYMANIIKGGL